MALNFSRAPDPAALSSIEELEPANPFLTVAYWRFRESLGDTGWMAYSDEGGESDRRFFLFERTGRRSRSLEIPTVPRGIDAAAWAALKRFTEARRVTTWRIETFAALDETLAELDSGVGWTPRMEFLLDLTAWEPADSLSSNHRRNARRGEKAGLELVETATDAAVELHARLIGSSLSRRRKRGETVPDHTSGDRAAALIRSGAGELFQASAGQDVRSSMLVLRSEEGGYYQSAGTSQAGRDCGASHWLIRSVAERLKERGIRAFFLGGATASQEGLVRFKAGFGARQIDLVRAEVEFRDGPLRKIARLLEQALGK